MLTVSVSSEQVDLASCAQEPIHIPGSIQPHGILLVLEDSSFVVLQASANATELFGSNIVGRSLAELFGSQWSGSFKAAIQNAALDCNPLYLRTLSVQTSSQNRPFHAIAHRCNGALILEMESAASEETVLFQDLYPLVRGFIAESQNVKTADDLSALAVREVRRITGFDRVLIYQFDSEWNGHVLAEDCDELLASYLDLWFPASDIPEQARELYRLNRLRLIADVDYSPVTIEPSLHPGTKQPLDLSFAVLRSVSPIHLEYLKNMNVGASMSISVIQNGKLWGLISCHHRVARLVSYEIRVACDFLGQAFALRLSAAEQAADYEQRLRLKLIESQLLTFMAREEHFVDGLTNHAKEMLELVGAAGAAVLFDERCSLIGCTPSEEAVRALVDWLADKQHHEIFHSDNLSTLFPDSQEYLEKASGVLAISISKLHRSFVFWFRPEVIQTVTWGGDPTKPVEQEINGSFRIHPRTSFEAWKSIVRGRSVPWDRAEIEIAGNLRISILEIVLRKAEEVAQLTEELRRSNKELEAFSYSVSHDLRAPFRHIVGYSSLLRERVLVQEDAEALRYVDTVIESARSAGSLVDSLLHFSQIGRFSLNRDWVSQAALVAEIQREAVRELSFGRQVTWRLNPLPEVWGDLVLLRLVWQNLLSNAIKYTRTKEQAVIEVGAEESETKTTFFVRDNGIGFDQRYAHKLFGVFQRLHRVEDFEGNGIGLANVRRVIARHGGDTWAEGTVEKGATFYFSLPKVARA